jgi:hypothetical protein
MAGHKHAVLMAEYAKDAAEHVQPWELWQCSLTGVWSGVIEHPKWALDTEYRRKPRTITINGIEVPEPLRVAPPSGTIYYVAMPCNANSYVDWTWFDDRSDIAALAQGMAHATRDAAEIHGNALNGFTKR